MDSSAADAILLYIMYRWNEHWYINDMICRWRKHWLIDKGGCNGRAILVFTFFENNVLPVANLFSAIFNFDTTIIGRH